MLFDKKIYIFLHLLLQVILESLRMASIVSFTFREAVVDVEYNGNSNSAFLEFYFCSSSNWHFNFFVFFFFWVFLNNNKWINSFIFLVGYLIPKGWKVMPLFRNIHHNPEFFSEPQKFDPYRFEVWEIFFFFCLFILEIKIWKC